MPSDRFLALRNIMKVGVEVEAMVAGIRQEHATQHRDAMIAAGLDPSRMYRLNDETLTAELVE